MSEEHDTDRALAELHADTDQDRPIEVYSGAGRRGGERVCFIASAALDEGSIGLQRILGPGQWRLVARRPDGTIRSASVSFAGRPRAFAFTSPHYIGPDAVDLVGTPWGPPDAPPSALAPPSSTGMVEQAIALAAAMRPPAPPDMTPILLALLQRPAPAAPDMGPMFAAMMQVVASQKGPSAAEMLELARALRPEPVESPWAGILETAIPVGAPLLASYLETKAAGAGAQGLIGTLSAIGAKLLSKVDAADDDDDDDEAPEPDQEDPPPSVGPAPQG
jgi:hypothetical protein